jgi:hypothetical protein
MNDHLILTEVSTLPISRHCPHCQVSFHPQMNIMPVSAKKEWEYNLSILSDLSRV